MSLTYFHTWLPSYRPSQENWVLKAKFQRDYTTTIGSGEIMKRNAVTTIAGCCYCFLAS